MEIVKLIGVLIVIAGFILKLDNSGCLSYRIDQRTDKLDMA